MALTPQQRRRRQARTKAAAIEARAAAQRTLPQGGVKPVNRQQKVRKALMKHDKDWSQRARLKNELTLRRQGKYKPPNPKKTPYDPTAPLTGKNFRKELMAATRLQYGDLERELEAERRISGATEANTERYWTDYQNSVERARQATQAGYQAAQQGGYAQVNAQATQQANQNAAADTQMQQDAALRGATPGVGSAAQAAASRQAMNNSAIGLIGAQGATQNAYMADVGRIGGLYKMQALGEGAARRKTLDEDARKLSKDKGLFKTKFRSDVRQSERQWAALRKTYNLDVTKAQLGAQGDAAKLKADAKKEKARRREDARKARRDRMEADRKFRLDRQKFGADEAERRWDRRIDAQREGRLGAEDGPGGDGKKKSTITPTQKRAYQAQFQRAVALLRADPKWSPDKAGQFVTALTGKGYPRELAQAAAQRVKYGRIKPANAQWLKAHGIKVPPPKRRPSKRGRRNAERIKDQTGVNFF